MVRPERIRPHTDGCFNLGPVANFSGAYRTTTLSCELCGSTVKILYLMMETFIQQQQQSFKCFYDEIYTLRAFKIASLLVA